MGLDGVTSFLCLKDVTNTRKRMRRSLKYWRDLFSAMAERWKKLKTEVYLLDFFCSGIQFYLMLICLFDYLRPINNLSVIKGRVFLG